VTQLQAGPRSWRDDFRRMWIGQSVSLLGSQVTLVALPLTAVTVLDAGAPELGLINTAMWLPFLLFSLPVGALADRVRRLPLLIWADLGRAVVMGAIASLALTDRLALPVLMVLLFGFGTLTVVFEVSYYSMVPTLVPSSYLVTANTRLQASASLAEMGGPSAGGILAQLFSAPVALVVDTFSYLVSAASLRAIRSSEPAPVRRLVNGVDGSRIRDGLRFTYRSQYLRACAACSTFSNLFDQWITVLLLVYAVEVLDLNALSIGLILATGAVGALIGSIANSTLTRRFELGKVVVWTFGLDCVATLAIPAVSSRDRWAWIVLASVYLLKGFGVAITSVATVSIRQAGTPVSMLGRVNATFRMFSYGAVAVGAFVGGLVGHVVGLRAGLLLGALGLLATAAVVALSPLRHLRSIDDVRVRDPAPVPVGGATEYRSCPRSSPRPM
jgi:MFS family permease